MIVGAAEPGGRRGMMTSTVTSPMSAGSRLYRHVVPLATAVDPVAAALYRAQRHIFDGDVFQLVLSIAWSAPATVDGLNVGNAVSGVRSWICAEGLVTA